MRIRVYLYVAFAGMVGLLVVRGLVPASAEASAVAAGIAEATALELTSAAPGSSHVRIARPARPVGVLAAAISARDADALGALSVAEKTAAAAAVACAVAVPAAAAPEIAAVAVEAAAAAAGIAPAGVIRAAAAPLGRVVQEAHVRERDVAVLIDEEGTAGTQAASGASGATVSALGISVS